MVRHNLNWSWQCPVTYFMGGTGSEHMAVQMDEKHTGQRKPTRAHFPPINMVCCGLICSAKKSHTLWFKLSLHICPAASCNPVQCVCVLVCVLVCVCAFVPGCVNHPSRSVRLLRHLMCQIALHLHDHVSLPVGEKAAPQQKGRKAERHYITSFKQLGIQFTIF